MATPRDDTCRACGGVYIMREHASWFPEAASQLRADHDSAAV